MATGIGKIDIEENTNATSSSKFCIASITKTFTSVLLANQIMKDSQRYGSSTERLTWDSPIYRHLGPWFSLSDKHREKTLTLRDLLAHRTGMSRYDLTWMLRVFRRKELMRKLKHFKFAGEFRQGFTYNNLMYALAGAVAEARANSTWETLIRTHLLQPLGMNETTFIDVEAPRWKNIAKPYTYKNGTYLPLPREAHGSFGVVGAAGSICSSAKDVAKWMQLHLNDGETQDGNRILKADDLETIFESASVVPQNLKWERLFHRPVVPVTESRTTYGLGWYNGHYRGLRTHVAHGTAGGYESQITLFPDRKLGIYTAMNGLMGPSAYIALRMMHQYIADVMMGQKPWLNRTTGCTFPEPWSENIYEKESTQFINTSLPAHRPFVDYTGVYINDGHGTIHISANTSYNYLYFKIGELGNFILYPMEERDRFHMKATYPYSFYLFYPLMFNNDTRGYINSISVPSFDVENPPIFFKQHQASDSISLATSYAFTLTFSVSIYLCWI
ncbi:unnamed protein product [Owenia fusiformis]|uniref:Uncharacterized protein n=1 Tax=Owenia fusiformis TaxID=6347 RepID=A0A8J1YD65_OWEFU|nr:unnamed protein product [Owenia fusiformis]